MLCRELADLTHNIYASPGQKATVGITSKNMAFTLQFQDKLHFCDSNTLRWKHTRSHETRYVESVASLLFPSVTPEWLHGLENHQNLHTNSGE